MSDSIITYFPSVKSQKMPRIDKNILENSGFQIIRDFGDSADKLKNFILGQGYDLCYIQRLNGWLHTFETKFLAQELSEEVMSGGFHTDLMFQEYPPRYIALQCIQPDPKYPYYGRNQIAKVSDLIEELLKFGFCKEELINLKIEYQLNDKTYEQSLFFDNLKSIKYHQKFAQENNKCPLQIVKLLNDLSLSVCEDFVLDTGDLLIIDNHRTLHRRSECSVKYNYDQKVFQGRKMNSTRFN